MVRTTLVTLALFAAFEAAAAERAATVSRAAVVCLNWAAWHEYGLASLSPKGARLGRLCPRRLRAGTKVVVIEEDAGEGASRVRSVGREWFVDAQRLK